MVSTSILAFRSIILLFVEHGMVYSSTPTNHYAFRRANVFDGTSNRSNVVRLI